MLQFPDGYRATRLSLTKGVKAKAISKRYGVAFDGGASLEQFIAIGARFVPGFQLRYIHFLNPAARGRLTVPVLPFSEIAARGAGMYQGKKHAVEASRDAAGYLPEEGGSTPTPPLLIDQDEAQE